MYYYTSLSASYLRTQADKFNNFMKCGTLSRVIEHSFK